MVVVQELEKTPRFEFLNDDRLAKKLFALVEKSGYEIIQVNGQRVYAPPAKRNILPPPRGCEVFIGKLHKNIFEDELIPIFETIGPLYKFRLMLNFREQTRGFAFATYFSKKHANLAVQRLDGYEIRRGLRIGVFKSVDNRRLFVGNLPLKVTKGDVKDMFCQYVEGVVEIIMYSDFTRPHLNRGFAFVEFENHRMAAMARRQFAPDNLIAWGQTLYVDWADPLPDVHPQIMSKVSILYLKNIPLDYTSEEIHTIVCNAVGAQLVKKVHKMQNYAFAHFVNRRSAELALEKLQGLVLYDEDQHHHSIGIEWARPRRFSKKFRLSNAPDNFCRSVPPNIRRLVFQKVADITSNSLLNRTDVLSTDYNSFINGVPGCSSVLND